MEDTKTLQVEVELQPATVSSNLEALDAYVTGAVEKYAGRDRDCSDPAEYKGAKAARAELNRLGKAIAAERIRAKKVYMKPFTAFEDRCKAIESKAKDGAMALGYAIDAADQQLRDAKRAALQEAYEEGAELLVPVVPLETMLAGEKWLNRSYNIEKAKQELAAKVARVADDWQALKDAGLGDALPDAEREFFRTIDLGQAIMAGHAAAEERRRIEDLRRAVEQPAPLPQPEPEPEPEPEPTYEADDVPRTWLVTVEGTKAQMEQLADALAALCLHGSIRPAPQP